MRRQVTPISKMTAMIAILILTDQVSGFSLSDREIRSGQVPLQCGPEHTSRKTTLSPDERSYQRSIALLMVCPVPL